MKLELTAVSLPFTPRQLTLVIESQDELNRLYHVFNYHPLVQYLELHNAEDFRITLKRSGAQDTNDEWRKLLEKLENRTTL